MSLRPRKVRTRLIVEIAIGAALQVYLAGCAAKAPPPPPQIPPAAPPQEAAPQREKFEATAYSVEGKTASGRESQRGIVAADPNVLPIGTHIRIEGAGQYSGRYVVADTGRKIKGRKIDIFIPDAHAARHFGKRSVDVEILRGERKAAAETR